MAECILEAEGIQGLAAAAEQKLEVGEGTKFAKPEEVVKSDHSPNFAEEEEEVSPFHLLAGEEE